MMTTPKITRTAIKMYSIVDWPYFFIILLSINKVYLRKAACASGIRTRIGNDTIDCYPPACEKVEKILCVSEKIFKKVVKDFEAFFRGSKGRPSQRSLIVEPDKGQIDEQ